MVPLLIVDAGSGTISGCEELAEVRCSRPPPLSPVNVSYSSVHHSSEVIIAAGLDSPQSYAFGVFPSR